MELLARALPVLALLLAAWAVGLWWRRREGRVRQGAGAFDRGQLRRLGLDGSGPGVRALLLSSPTCSPCRTVRRILGEVSGERPEFRWVVVDAADHIELARTHHVMRVPTLFVLDGSGRILARTSGVPARRDLERLLDREPVGRAPLRAGNPSGP